MSRLAYPLLFLLALLAFAAEPAEAGWQPPRPIAGAGEPRVALARPDGGFWLWAGNRSGARFDLSLQDAVGQARPLPAFRTGGSPWAANDRGDVVRVAADGARLAVVAHDAAGTSATIETSVPWGYKVQDVSVAVGADGTAAIAWTAEDDENLEPAKRIWLAVRPPGGQFTPLEVATPSKYGGASVATDVRPDGMIEVAFEGGTGLYHLEFRVGGPVGIPTRIAGGFVEEISSLDLLAGGDGASRIIVDSWALLRTTTSTWVKQTLARKAYVDEGALAPLPGGGAVVAYTGNGVAVRRAPTGAVFGAPQRVATVPRRWFPYLTAVAAGARGDVLVAWIESSEEDGLRFGYVCGDACHERVVAVVATPDGRFGPPRRLTPLGAFTTESLALAVSPTGERLVAWQSGGTGALGFPSLMVALGDATPDEPEPRDAVRPRVHVELSRARLRAAAPSGRLRARTRCSEPCSARVTVLSRDDGLMLDLDSLAPVVHDRAGTARATWDLTRGERKTVKRLLGFRHLWLVVRATDAAGNIFAGNRRMR